MTTMILDLRRLSILTATADGAPDMKGIPVVARKTFRRFYETVRLEDLAERMTFFTDPRSRGESRQIAFGENLSFLRREAHRFSTIH